MAVPRLLARRKKAAGAIVLALAMRERPSRGLRPLVRGLEPRRGATRGLLVEVRAGGSFSLWGKVSMSWFLFSDAFAFSWVAVFTYAHSSSLRLKRMLEQAQPSMAKRLKVGAASKDSG